MIRADKGVSDCALDALIWHINPQCQITEAQRQALRKEIARHHAAKHAIAIANSEDDGRKTLN